MCCGSNRAAARAAVMASGTGPATPTAAHSGTPSSVIVFECVAGGARTIRGPVSGQMYHFTGLDDRLRVDPRDRRGLMSVPTLRWVR